MLEVAAALLVILERSVMDDDDFDGFFYVAKAHREHTTRERVRSLRQGWQMLNKCVNPAGNFPCFSIWCLEILQPHTHTHTQEP